jgi:aryl-phospho-beta-D-glucosidase BglC (GH1 family)
MLWLSLWSSGQSSWLQIQRSGFNSLRYDIFWEVVGLELGPFSLVTTIEELFERKSNGSGLETREYGLRDFCIIIV